MKKLTILILASLFFVSLNSCQEEELEEGVEVVGTDFAAFGSTLAELLETGGGESCPPCAFIMATLVGTLESGNASSAAHRSTIGKTEASITLPEEFKLKNNPFECVGITHNKLLFKYTKEDQAQQLANFSNGNEESLRDAINTFAMCHEINQNEKEIALTFTKSKLDSYRRMNTSNSKFGRYTENDVFNVLNSLKSPQALFFREFMTSVKQKENSQASKENIIQYINTRINNVFANDPSFNNETQLKAASLTLYKHSYFFWK